MPQRRALPQGETPDEAIERIAPTPASIKVEVSGIGDDVDIEVVESAFRKLVRSLRHAGLAVNGALTGNVPALAGAREQRVLHELAGDADDD